VAAIAAITPGFSGADLANLVNEAALLATREGKNQVEAVDFTHAVERLVAGLEKKNRVLNAKERRIVAYHELGHAIVATAIPGCDPVHKISIIPRGIGALGYTMQRPLEDRYLMTRQELLDKMSVLLGGRAAEGLVFDEISTGAADDLDRATEIARSMVARYGMAPRLGLATYDRERHPQLGDLAARQNFGEATADAIDEEVRTLLDDAFRRSMSLLGSRREDLDEIAAILLEKETIAGEELKRILERRPAAADVM
jgi:cell division protease FtsH